MVTLTKTQNKMPRWLSEGISVYEERQEDPAWGQVMNPQYRELILEGGATPVEQAERRVPEAADADASAVRVLRVVDGRASYVVERFGLAALKEMLDDLGEGRRDQRGAGQAHGADRQARRELREVVQRAGRATGAARRRLGAAPSCRSTPTRAAMAAWNKEHPNSFWGLLGEGRGAARGAEVGGGEDAAGEGDRRCTRLRRGGRALRAAGRGVIARLGETPRSAQMLEKHVALDADAVEPPAAADGDRRGARRTGRPVAEQARAGAGDQPADAGAAPLPRRGGRGSWAIGDWRSRPTARCCCSIRWTAAEHHYRLASCWRTSSKLRGRAREVVRSLEEAPRYPRARTALLLEIVGEAGTAERRRRHAAATTGRGAGDTSRDAEPDAADACNRMIAVLVPARSAGLAMRVGAARRPGAAPGYGAGGARRPGRRPRSPTATACPTGRSTRSSRATSSPSCASGTTRTAVGRRRDGGGWTPTTPTATSTSPSGCSS